MRAPDRLAAATPLVVCAPVVASLSQIEAAPAARSGSGGGTVRFRTAAGIAIVTTPSQVGTHNAQDFWAALAAACARHPVTVADLTGTQVCGHDVVTVLLMALRCTDKSGGQLWLAISAAVDKVLAGTAIRGAFRTFRRLEDALAVLPGGQGAPPR